MRIIVVTGTTAAAGGFHAQDIRRAALARGDSVFVCSWRDLSAGVGIDAPVARAGEIILDHADVVLVRAMSGGSLEQIVFRMDLLHRLQTKGVLVLNTPRAIELSVDKYLALACMQSAGVPVPATMVCQRTDDAMIAFDRLDRDVVIKPLFGSEGAGITRVTDADVAWRVFKTLERMNSVIYVQRYIEHGTSDLRLFVLGDRVLTAMRRVNDDDWRTNIARGGEGERIDPEPAWCELALRAARSCETDIAGVDILIDTHAQPHVLEINAVPGWKALAPVTGLDIAAHALEYVHQQRMVHHHAR